MGVEGERENTTEVVCVSVCFKGHCKSSSNTVLDLLPSVRREQVFIKHVQLHTKTLTSQTSWVKHMLGTQTRGHKDSFVHTHPHRRFLMQAETGFCAVPLLWNNTLHISEVVCRQNFKEINLDSKDLVAAAPLKKTPRIAWIYLFEGISLYVTSELLIQSTVQACKVQIKKKDKWKMTCASLAVICGL